MGELELIPMEGGLSKEQALAGRIRRQLEALNSVLKDIDSMGMSVTLISGQRDMQVGATVRAHIKVNL